MQVALDMDKKQPEEIGTSPCADGEVEAREVAGGNLAKERLSWGLTHLACSCHPREREPWALAWTLPLPSLRHLAALSLCCGADDPRPPDLQLGVEVWV